MSKYTTLWMLVVLSAWITPARAQQICVADPNSKGWLCGTAEEIAQVKPRQVERPASRTPATPPAYLLDPNRIEAGDYQNPPLVQSTPAPAPTAAPYVAPAPAPPSRGVPASLVPPAPAPGTASTNRPASSAASPPHTPAARAQATSPAVRTAAAPPAVAPAPAATAPADQAQVDRNIEKLAELTAEEPPAQTAAVNVAPAPSHPAPAAQPSASAANQAAATATPVASVPVASVPVTPVATTPGATPAPTPNAPAAAARPAPAAVSALPARQSGSERFVGWGAREYTIQLVASASPEGFASFAERAGLSLASMHQVRLQQPEQTWWLLCYGRYESLAQAQAALATLNQNARSSGAWPRRIGPLQAEQEL